MKKIFLLAAFVLLVNGCAIVDYGKVPLTPEQIKFMQKVMSQELTFVTDKDGAERAWANAYRFLTKYSDMKLQVANDYVLETYNPSLTPNCVKYGYTVLRLKEGDRYEISVRGVHEGNPYLSWLDENLHILAHYLKTGELDCPELIGYGCSLRLWHAGYLRSQYNGEEFKKTSRFQK